MSRPGPQVRMTRTAALRAQKASLIQEQKKTALPLPIWARKSHEGIPRVNRTASKKSELVQYREKEEQLRKLDHAVCEIGGGMGNMKREITELDIEIRHEMDGEKEFQDQLNQLRKKKVVLEKRIVESEKWIADFDRDVQPFQQRYQDNIREAERSAEEARKRTQQAMTRLREKLRAQGEYL